MSCEETRYGLKPDGTLLVANRGWFPQFNDYYEVSGHAKCFFGEGKCVVDFGKNPDADIPYSENHLSVL